MNIKEFTNQEAKRLAANFDFQAIVMKIRKFNYIPKAGIANDEKLEQWYEKFIYKKLNAENPLDSGVAYLLMKFGLGPDWRHSIKRYVLMGNLNDMQLPSQISVGNILDKETGTWQTIMYIPDYANQKDIKATLPRVSFWQNEAKRLNGMKQVKKQPIPQQALGEEADAIYTRVKSYKKTAEELSKIKGKVFTQQRAIDLVRRHRKRVGGY